MAVIVERCPNCGKELIGPQADKLQRMELAGDALATAVARFVGSSHSLIRLWDEAKRHGEVGG